MLPSAKCCAGVQTLSWRLRLRIRRSLAAGVLAAVLLGSSYSANAAQSPQQQATPLAAPGQTKPEQPIQRSTEGQAVSNTGPAAAPPVTPPAPPLSNAVQQQSPAQVDPATPPVQKETKPLGTGAAPEMGAHGVAASRPAGAAIAPGKQKRNISFSVRTALVVGGAVALGVVTGLTLGTSGRPH